MSRSRKLRDLYESVGYRWVHDQRYPWLEPPPALSLYEKVLPDSRDRPRSSISGGSRRVEVTQREM